MIRCKVSSMVLALVVLACGSTAMVSVVRADTLIDFESGIYAQAIPISQYEPLGALIYGASTFQREYGSWLSTHSGEKGMYPSAGVSHDGTTYQDILASHNVALSTGGGVADIHFVVPGTTDSWAISNFTIGYGYDADGGEPNQAVIIEAFDAADQRIVDVVKPNLYYDGYQTFSAPGAVRLRLTQNGYVGFDDLRFTPVPEPSTFALLGMGAVGLMGWAWRRKRFSR